jgi:hypothetical protein
MSQRVTREDLENKLREVQENLRGATEEARRSGTALAIGLFLVLLGLAYFLGRRAGRRRGIVVELKRG